MGNWQCLLHDKPVASTESLGRWNMQECVERAISKMKNDYKLICSLMIILNSLLLILLCPNKVPPRLSDYCKPTVTVVLRNLEVIEKQIVIITTTRSRFYIISLASLTSYSFRKRSLTPIVCELSQSLFYLVLKTWGTPSPDPPSSFLSGRFLGTPHTLAKPGTLVFPKCTFCFPRFVSFSLLFFFFFPLQYSFHVFTHRIWLISVLTF